MDHHRLKCYQVNLQHSRAAIKNLVQLINEHGVDIIFIQEPYTINNKLAGIPNSLRTYTCGDRRKRAAIIINNKNINAIAINQISDGDCIVTELIYKGAKFFGASIYFDGEEDIEEDLRKVEQSLDYAKGNGLMILADTNARSKLWYDTINNERGKILEEFLTVKSLHIINENKDIPTFETIRGRSWVDLTITNDQLLRHVTEWKIEEDESCSDHKIISFKIGEVNQCIINTSKGIRYITKDGDSKKFDDLLTTNLTSAFSCQENREKLDEELTQKVSTCPDIEQLMETCYTCIREASNGAFRVSKGKKQQTRGKSVPWWTTELTILRKRVNALRRRFQRTVNNEQLREERRIQYLEGNREYQLTIKHQKINSWKEFCNITDGSNPWNAVYKIATGKMRVQNSLQTLQKDDGTYTTEASFISFVFLRKCRNKTKNK